MDGSAIRERKANIQAATRMMTVELSTRLTQTTEGRQKR